MMNRAVSIAAAAALAAFVSLPALAWASVVGDGTKTTSTRQLGPFQGIESSLSLDLEVSEAEGAPVVSVFIDSNLQPLVTTVVKDGTLFIGASAPINYSGEGRVTIKLPELHKLVLDGSGDAKVRTTPKPRDLTILTAGSGNVEVEGAATKLDLVTQGSGGARFVGPAERARFESQGSGDLEFKGPCQEMRVTLQGSGDAHLEGTGEQLTVTSQGSGDVDASAFVTRSAELRSHGSGNIAARLRGGTLVARTTGSGDITWRGQAQIRAIDADGSGSIEYKD